MSDSAVTSGPRSSYAVRVAVAATTVLVLLLAVWAASTGPDDPLRAPGPVDEPFAETTMPTQDATPIDDGERQDPQERSGNGWITAVIAVFVLGVGVLVVVGLLYLLGAGLWSLRRERWSRAQREEPPAPLDPIRAVAAEMVADADEQEEALLGGTPRNAVVACWHRFEVQAERAGLGREAWETSSEFTLRLLDLVEADAASVGRLSELYREARFSEHEVDESARARALEALRDIHRDLRTLLSGGRVS